MNTANSRNNHGNRHNQTRWNVRLYGAGSSVKQSYPGKTQFAMDHLQGAKPRRVTKSKGRLEVAEMTRACRHVVYTVPYTHKPRFLISATAVTSPHEYPSEMVRKNERDLPSSAPSSSAIMFKTNIIPDALSATSAS